MVEVERELVVVAFATKAELDRNKLEDDPIAELNERVTPENSLLVVRLKDGEEHRLYCEGQRVEGFEVVGKAPYAVAARLNGGFIDIGNSAGGPVVVNGTTFRTPTVFFTGDNVATVTLVKKAGEPDKLEKLTF